jgi:hypothetical protein
MDFCLNRKRKAPACAAAAMIDFELDSPVVALFFFHFISFVRESVGRSVTKSLGKSRARNFLGGRP